MTEDELDLIETSERIDALQRRLGPSGACLVATLQDRTNTDEAASIYYRGGWMNAIGLARYAEFDILRRLNAPQDDT